MGALCSSGTEGKRLNRATPIPNILGPTSPVNATDPQSPSGLTDKRQLHAAAAEKRIAESKARGGVNAKRVQEVDQAALKAQYVGKITTHYQMRNEDVPMGLKLLTLEKLKEHYQGLVQHNRKEGLINRFKQ